MVMTMNIVAFEPEFDTVPVLRKEALEILQETPERRFRAVLVCMKSGKVLFRNSNTFRTMNGGDPESFLGRLSSDLMDAKPSIVGR